MRGPLVRQQRFQFLPTQIAPANPNHLWGRSIEQHLVKEIRVFAENDHVVLPRLVPQFQVRQAGTQRGGMNPGTQSAQADEIQRQILINEHLFHVAISSVVCAAPKRRAYSRQASTSSRCSCG